MSRPSNTAPAPNSPSPAAPELRPVGAARPRFMGMRVVVALILREMTTSYGRNPGGYVWAILQPLMIVVILSVAFSFLLRAPSLGISFLLFYTTGFLPLRMFQEVGKGVGLAVIANQPLLAYPRVTFTDTLMARAILAVLTQLMVSVIVFRGILFWEGIRPLFDFRPIILAYVSTITLSVGVGTLNAYLMFSFPVWRTIWNTLTAPLLLLSGIIYIYEDLPQGAQDILWFNPLIHITGLMRTGFYPTYEPSYLSMLYVYTVALVPMFFGVLVLKRFARDALYK